MNPVTDAATLRALYAPIRENPHDKKAKMIGSILPDSGFAKPFLAMAMGQEMANGEGWDANREKQASDAEVASTRQAGEAAQQSYAAETMKRIISLSEKDPVAATQLLKVESENGDNPFLQKFRGITFNAPTKDGWATNASADGYVYHTYLPNLSKALEEQQAGDDTLYNKTVVRIGGGRPAKDPKAPIAVQKGDRVVYIDPVTKEEVSGLGGPKWDPNAHNPDGKPRKEVDIVKDIRTSAGMIASRPGRREPYRCNRESHDQRPEGAGRNGRPKRPGHSGITEHP